MRIVLETVGNVSILTIDDLEVSTQGKGVDALIEVMTKLKKDPYQKIYNEIEVAYLIDEINKVIGAARMDQAHISPIEGVEFDRENPTLYIKFLTKLYRESWIINPLSGILKKLEHYRKGEGLQ